MKTARIFVLMMTVLSMLFSVSWADETKQRSRRPFTVIYKIKPELSAQEQNRLTTAMKFLGTRAKKKFRNLDINLDEYVSWPGSEEEASRLLMDTGALLYAEPDYLIPPDLTGNDPYADLQWQHSKINAYSAWEKTTGDDSVIVAVCDTGISSAHPDLAANMLPGFNTVDGSTNTEPVNNHGTGVAGCIGAVGNNAIGVTGVAWDVRILPIRITNSADGMAYLSDAAEGIRYAADQEAKVVNLSYRMASYSTTDQAAQYLRQKGGLLFVAAGNDGLDPGWPDFPSFLAVGATTSSDTRASWSNYGTYIDLVAPGVNVFSTSGQSSYGYMSGTSFSSPITAGLAALLFSVDTSFTPEQVESFILDGCVDLGDLGEDNQFGRGRIDAAQSVALAMNAEFNDPPVALLTVDPREGTASLSVSADGSDSYDPDGEINSYHWDFGDGGTATGVSPDHVYSKEGTFTVTLTVTDDKNSSASATTQVVVRPDPASVIYVGSISMSLATVSRSKIAKAEVLILDQNEEPRPGASVTVKWSGTVASTVVGKTGSDGKVVLTSPNFAGGVVTATVTAVSLSGYTYDASKNIETSKNIGTSRNIGTRNSTRTRR